MTGDVLPEDVGRELRQARQRELWMRWQELHERKNKTADRETCDRLSAEMRGLEAAMERLKEL